MKHLGDTDLAGRLLLGGSAGSSGQVLTSAGSGSPPTWETPSGGAATNAITASEALSAGDVVSLHDSTGARARKANATDNTKPAQGFVLSAVSSSATATVYRPGQVITGLSSLTPGTRYFLSTTGGAITATAPSTTGNIVQCVGWALSATELMFWPEAPILL